MYNKHSKFSQIPVVWRASLHATYVSLLKHQNTKENLSTAYVHYISHSTTPGLAMLSWNINCLTEETIFSLLYTPCITDSNIYSVKVRTELQSHHALSMCQIALFDLEVILRESKHALSQLKNSSPLFLVGHASYKTQNNPWGNDHDTPQWLLICMGR